MVTRVRNVLPVPAICLFVVLSGSNAFSQTATLQRALIFGSRNLECPGPDGNNYEVVFHTSPDSVEYQAERGFGYEVLYPADSPYGDRGGYGKYGPFDDSPNNRNVFGDDCPEQLYDSFIGAKNFLTPCNADTEGDPNTPCAGDVEGIIFRVDVPNGMYRFVAVVGSADNAHVSRILAEDGGAGTPDAIGPHVVLAANFNQAEQERGVLGSVGFDDKAPPAAEGVGLVDLGESPVLNVTQGYIRIHQLQGNSNEGVRGADANGGNMVLLELWRIEPEPVPATSFGGLAILFALMAGATAWVLVRRKLATAHQ